LQFHQRASDRMHRDTVERLVESCYECGYFDCRILPQQMQRPCAIFAAGPRKSDSLQAAAAFTGEVMRSRAATVRLSQACSPNRTAVKTKSLPRVRPKNGMAAL